ncbi:hypothetical protein SESBI_45858 [Sesbania bispinosa]|nr:hypothetical protein SESBI_45858 [Sesbania bispinosa]
MEKMLPQFEFRNFVALSPSLMTVIVTLSSIGPIVTTVSSPLTLVVNTVSSLTITIAPPSFIGPHYHHRTLIVGHGSHRHSCDLVVSPLKLKSKVAKQWKGWCVAVKWVNQMAIATLKSAANNRDAIDGMLPVSISSNEGINLDSLKQD